MNAFLNACWIIMLLFIWSCASSGEIRPSGRSDDPTSNNNRVQVRDRTLTLADYLRRVPGVVISGSGNNVKVTIRGASSFIASTDPLYVVDGQPVGTSYAQVSNLVSIYDIDRLEVLKGSDAAIYGVRGGNGVILITTRGNE